MIWKSAKQLARRGVPVRAATWPLARSLVYWPPGKRYTPVIVTTISGLDGVTVTRTVVRAQDFGRGEFTRVDWVRA